MNREDIIRMARDAKFSTEEWGDGLHHVCVYNFQGSETEITEELERFAYLVASAEREKHKWDIHSCSPTCNRYACVATREAVLAEREACAKVCENSVEYAGDTLAEAIRARGNVATNDTSQERVDETTKQRHD
jgi:hypothetical protein